MFFFSVRIRENTDQKKLRIWTLFTQWEWHPISFNRFLPGFPKLQRKLNLYVMEISPVAIPYTLYYKT